MIQSRSFGPGLPWRRGHLWRKIWLMALRAMIGGFRCLAVGPGRFDEDGAKRIPLDIAVGDVVIYSKYGGTEVKYNGEDYLLLSARDVLAIVEK